MIGGSRLGSRIKEEGGDLECMLGIGGKDTKGWRAITGECMVSD